LTSRRAILYFSQSSVHDGQRWQGCDSPAKDSFTVLDPGYALRPIKDGIEESAFREDSGVANARTILVIEDNLVEREGLAAVLRKEGYSTVLATNGREALERLQAGAKPDAMLLDMMMPEMDGWQFLKLLPEHPTLLTIPIVIVTGLKIANLEWARTLGAVAVIRKPIDVEQLKDTLANLLTSDGFDRREIVTPVNI
jgi:CheY-like chemotaxis protein